MPLEISSMALDAASGAAQATFRTDPVPAGMDQQVFPEKQHDFHMYVLTKLRPSAIIVP
jgi:hypothetical protein